MSARLLLLPALLSSMLFLACGDKDDDTGTGDGGADGGGSDGGGAGDGGMDGGGTDDGGTAVYDADGDGYHMGIDCDDSNAAINPGADELCNGVDDNCDEIIDTDAVDSFLYYQDRDEDGYGNPLAVIVSCDARTPDGHVTNGLDCRDSDADINPLGREVCDDQNLDENCDGLREDDDPTASTLTMFTFYADYDGDGYGDSGTLVQGCDEGGVRAVNSIDCDDSDDAVGPDSTCAPWDGIWTGTVDFDFDGLYGIGGNCDDSNSITISDISSNQVSGSVRCDWYLYGYYMLNMTMYGTISYPWGISGYWTDSSNYFNGSSMTTTSFTGTFSEDGNSLVVEWWGEREGYSGYYDLEITGTWTLTR